RSEIGHWELDTVQGQKNGNDSVVLVMTDRLSRVNITSKIGCQHRFKIVRNHRFKNVLFHRFKCCFVCCSV
ncbi:hypothetical protein LMC06_00690, partial [Limosilactobacillus reuteri]|nr:hypothetical protein [Limosilactobacillus reuteri]